MLCKFADLAFLASFIITEEHGAAIMLVYAAFAQYIQFESKKMDNLAPICADKRVFIHAAVVNTALIAFFMYRIIMYWILRAIVEPVSAAQIASVCFYIAIFLFIRIVYFARLCAHKYTCC